MSQLAEFEKRARETILSKTVEDYQRQQPHWQNEAALIMTVLVACLCSWQNVALLGATVLVSGLLLAIVHPIPIIALFVVISLGGVVELVFLFMSSADKQRLAAAVAELHAPRVVFAVETIRTKHLRAKLGQALQYWGLIDTMQRNQPDGILRDRLAGASQEMTRWLQGVYHLAGRIDEHRCNSMIQRELQTLPQVIQSYEQKLSREKKLELHAQLQQILASKQQQLQTLGELQNNIEKAAHQLDSTIASMGVVYSQLLLLVSTRNVESGRMNRLQAEIAEEVQRLEDLTTAIREFTGYPIKPESTG
ncbi:MAG: hypothetical protein HYR94_22025 [Chloroflexi bacterium]|nr:hypothetical protein [Chloroflexota bacterium]